jgi:hypothetical protein
VAELSLTRSMLPSSKLQDVLRMIAGRLNTMEPDENARPIQAFKLATR